MSSKTIVTYLVNGDATWIKTVEFSNRLIKWIFTSRKDFKGAKNRRELSNSWIYFLLWEDEEWKQLAYLWQATVLWKRLNDHYNDSKKDFWNTAVAFTYKDWTLNESDINYLERELITQAKSANRYEIKNWNWGNNWLIQEYRVSDMLEFIFDLKILLESLWFKIFKKLIPTEKIKNKEDLYFLSTRWSEAKMVFTNEWVVVLKWSKWPLEMQKGVLKNKWYSYRNRPLLIDKWIIREQGSTILFCEDHLFSSPSSAASFVAWASLNWWMEWKNIDNQTLDEIKRQEGV